MRKNRLLPYPAAVLATARRRRLLGPDDVVLVALSAGPDSTALLAALAALRDEGEVRAVAALHVDHGLRGGAEDDLACAAEACARLGVPLERVKVRVCAGNVQAEARRARYAALTAAADRAGATRIATGHTRTDQAETVLLRLLRGAGARGLGAIPPRRGRIVRPLIDRSREEGLAFLRASGLRWRDDPTNATPRYARNRLRLGAWPALVALAPAAERALARAADLAREDERALAAVARGRVGAATSIPTDALAAEPAAIRRRIVRRLWTNAAGRDAGALELHHVDAVLALASRRAPGRAALPGGFEACCRYGVLEIGPGALPAEEVPLLEVTGPGRYHVAGREVTVVAARPDAVAWPLELRGRRAGDTFRPDRGRGSKSLKRWLIDRKVPREERDGLLILAAPGGRVLALPDLGVVAAGLGPSGAGLVVRVAAARRRDRSYCKSGAGLL